MKRARYYEIVCLLKQDGVRSGVVDEMAMRALADEWNLSLADRDALWRELTRGGELLNDRRSRVVSLPSFPALSRKAGGT